MRECYEHKNNGVEVAVVIVAIQLIQLTAAYVDVTV